MVTFNNDIDVLNYALTLEHFENALYKALIGANVLQGVEQQYLTTFGAQEQTHVDTLTQVITKLGGTPVKALPAYNLAAAGPITNRTQLVNALAVVEDIGASAYLGAAGFIQSKDLLEAAVTIHAVEAEHASIIRDLAGMVVSPDVVAKGRTPDEVITLVTPFLAAPGPTTAPPVTAPPNVAVQPPPNTTTQPSTGTGTVGSSGPVGSGQGNSSPVGGTQGPTTSTGGPPSAPGKNFVRRLGDG